MIGKIIFFVVGFLLGTLFGTAIGRWLIEQILNFLQTKII